MNFMNPEKHYNTLTNYYNSFFHAKIAKISLNGGFTCPNRDGSKGYGGCKFCSEKGSGEFAGNPELSLKEQFNQVEKAISNKWPNSKYIVYFQSYTNTYKRVDELKQIYEEALGLSKEIVGISIATRSDCLENDKIDYLKILSEKTLVQVELGLQTSNELTAEKMNRMSSNAEFEDAVKRLAKANINIVCHIINGLPGDTKNDMINTIKYLNSLPIQGIKIHNLMLLKNTALAKEYEIHNFPILSLNDYVEIVCEQICNLRNDIIIHRLSADSDSKNLIAPLWSNKKMVVMNEIDKKMRRENLYQGQFVKI